MTSLNIGWEGWGRHLVDSSILNKTYDNSCRGLKGSHEHKKVTLKVKGDTDVSHHSAIIRFHIS